MYSKETVFLCQFQTEKGEKEMSISKKVRFKQTDSAPGVSEVAPYHRPLLGWGDKWGLSKTSFTNTLTVFL